MSALEPGPIGDARHAVALARQVIFKVHALELIARIAQRLVERDAVVLLRRIDLACLAAAAPPASPAAAVGASATALSAAGTVDPKVAHHSPTLESRAHCRQQACHCNRLLQELERAEARSFHGGVDRRVTRHHDDRHRQLPGGRPLLQQCDAIGVRHPDIEQHEVKFFAARADRAAAAFSAVSTACPSSARISDSSSRMPISSSTTRMLAMAD